MSEDAPDVASSSPRLLRRGGAAFLVAADGSRWRVRDCSWARWAPQWTELASGLATHRIFTHADGVERIYAFGIGASRALTAEAAAEQLLHSEWLARRQQFDPTNGAT